MSMTKGMIFRFALARSKKIINDTSEYPQVFLHIILFLFLRDWRYKSKTLSYEFDFIV